MSVSTQSRHAWRRLRNGDLGGLCLALADRIWPARPGLRPAALAAAAGRVGLEIGGPSRVFAPDGMLPVYGQAKRLDNVNFTSDTAWEFGLRDGGSFVFDPAKPAGTQWLREAVDLAGLADGTYDFVLSSHCLEHVADPLRALQEWRRVLRPGGHLVLVLPDPARTFDHRRPVTTLEHLRQDRARGTGEDDLTHVDEALRLHDVSRDPGVGSAAEFKERVQLNPRNRCLHHHVFDLALVRAALAETGWTLLAAERTRPLHLVALARKETA